VIDCPQYVEACLAYNFNSGLSDMLGDDRYSIYNVLNFLNVIGLATLI
jgi:hypothetical protein